MHDAISPNPWMMLPFGLLLGTIALAPLLCPKWWARHYPKVALALGGVTLAYYLFGLHANSRVLHVAHEYVSFIALIGALFVVSGGIHIAGSLKSTPAANTLLLGIGALLSNFIGTTGASMVLIRPLLVANSRRKHHAHITIFFIFLVINIGGSLTPLGDPPLFLGFLHGVPFFWTLIVNCVVADDLPSVTFTMKV